MTRRVRGSEPYPLIARAASGAPAGKDGVHVVRVGDAAFGAPTPVVIAGPCAVESYGQTLEIAHAVRAAGADMLRGGAFKPRTSPYDFQGLGQEGLEILAEARRQTGLPVVTEVLDVRDVERVARCADMLQIGARNMQHVPLLVEAARTGMPILLKRHWGATLDEWLGAAEYIALEGNLGIVLCERGIRSFTQGTYNRNTLDVNIVPAVKRRTFLPIIVDPSHATGDAALVPGAGRAGCAAGADGLIVEVIGEKTPSSAPLCDGDQSIRPSVLAALIDAVRSPGTSRSRIEALA